MPTVGIISLKSPGSFQTLGQTGLGAMTANQIVSILTANANARNFLMTKMQAGDGRETSLATLVTGGNDTGYTSTPSVSATFIFDSANLTSKGLSTALRAKTSTFITFEERYPNTDPSASLQIPGGSSNVAYTTSSLTGTTGMLQLFNYPTALHNTSNVRVIFKRYDNPTPHSFDYYPEVSQILYALPGTWSVVSLQTATGTTPISFNLQKDDLLYCFTYCLNTTNTAVGVIGTGSNHQLIIQRHDTDGTGVERWNEIYAVKATRTGTNFQSNEKFTPGSPPSIAYSYVTIMQLRMQSA